jgi:hypothetical protein
MHSYRTKEDDFNAQHLEAIGTKINLALQLQGDGT